MASYIRMLFFIILLAAVVPTHNHFLKAKKDHTKKHSHKGLGILGCFGIFARGVSRKCDHSCDIFTEISKCDQAGDFDQSIDVIISVAKGSGGIIDELFSGLGSLFSNLVISSHRIIFCVLKTTHKHTKLSLCSDNDYGHRWGWKRYSGHYDDIENVIKCYNLENCRKDVEDLLDKYTNGKGLKSLIGTKKLIAEAIWYLAGLFQRDYQSWCSDDAHLIFLKVVTIAGALAKNHRSELGNDVVDGLISYCGNFFKELGCSDISTWASNIKKDLEQCDREDFNGAITYDNNDDDDDDCSATEQDNENNSSSDANASSQQSSSNQNNVATSNKNDNSNSQATNIVINNQVYVYDDDNHSHDKVNSTTVDKGDK